MLAPEPGFTPPRIPQETLAAATEYALPAIRQLQQAPRLPQSAGVQYDPAKRVDLWLSAIHELLRQQPDDHNLPRVLFDGSKQGSGKSHDVPDLALHWLLQDPDLLYRSHDPQWCNSLANGSGFIHGTDPQPKNTRFGIFYVSTAFRSPSIQDITDRFEEIPTRHAGIVHVVAPDGGFVRRTLTAQEVKDGVRPDEPATCRYAHRLQSLVGKGFGYTEAVEGFCKDRCPYRPIDPENPGDGGDGSCLHRQNTAAFWEGHKGATEPSPKSPAIRCSVQTLEGLLHLVPGFLSDSLLVFDEAPQLIDAAIKTYNLSTRRLGELLAYTPVLFAPPDDYVAKAFPELIDEIATAKALTDELLTLLMQLLTQITSPHGIDHHAVRQHLAPWIEKVIATYGHGDDICLPQQWALNATAHTVQPYQFEAAITSGDSSTLDNLPSPLLPQLIHCVLGLDAGSQFKQYSLSVTKARSGCEGAKPQNYRITLTTPSGLLQRLAERSLGVLVTDATADPELIKAMFARPDGSIAFHHVITQPVPATERADVLFFQVQDLGAMTARNRRDHQTQRLDAIRANAAAWAAPLLDKSPDRIKVGFIDHKACAKPNDGKWFTSTARGGNQFQNHDVIGLVGKPIKNVSASLSEYVAVTGDASASTGCAPEENSPAFIRYQAQQVAAELQQAWERLRTVRRTGERLIVLFISDADLSSLPIDVTQIAAADIAPAAAHKTEQKLLAAVSAVHELAADGMPIERISTRRVAALAGISESSLRRIAQHQTNGKPWLDFVRSCLP